MIIEIVQSSGEIAPVSPAFPLPGAVAVLISTLPPHAYNAPSKAKPRFQGMGRVYKEVTELCRAMVPRRVGRANTQIASS